MFIVISDTLPMIEFVTGTVKRRFTVEGWDFWIFSQDADDETVTAHYKAQAAFIRKRAEEQRNPKSKQEQDHEKI